MGTNETEINRLSWDYAIRYHNIVKGNVAKVIQAGKGYVFDEIKSFFPSIVDKTLLQLFCNDGRELLTLLRDGGRGIGIDFSENALQQAIITNQSLRCDCEFTCQDVLTWLNLYHSQFINITFTSLGSLWWVADLHLYFSLINRITLPGGTYIIWDFHPFIHIFDDLLRAANDYPLEMLKRFHSSGVEDYVTDSTAYFFEERVAPKNPTPFINPHPVYDYLWGMGQIIESACTTGWVIQRMVEYPYLLGEQYLSSLVRDGETRFIIPDGYPKVPLMFVMVLEKSKV